MLSLLKAKRMQKGLKQYEVAQAVGISESLLSKIENGRYLPSQTIVKSFAKFYHMDFKSLNADIESSFNQRFRIEVLK